MRTGHSLSRKTSTAAILASLILACLPGLIHAQTTTWHYITFCPDDSYTMSTVNDKRFTYQWERSAKEPVGDWTDWEDIPRATRYYLSYTFPSYKVKYRFRCEVTYLVNSGYPDAWECTGYNETPPTAPTTVLVSGDNYCPDDAPSTITLSCSGGTYYSTYQWFTGGCGSSDIGSGSPIYPSAPSSTTTYYVRSTSSGHCQPSSCATVVATVKTESTLPSQILASDNNICPGNSVTLSLDGGSLGTGAYWRWQVGTTYKGSGETHETGPLATTTTYSVRPYSGDCDGTFTPVVKEIVVNEVPVAADGITADDDSLCVGGSTILRQDGGSDGSNTTWRWYKGSCGGSAPVGNGDLYNTGDLTVTTTFYLRAEDDCDTTECVSKTVTVVPLSIDTQPEAATVCVAGTTSVSVSATGVGLQYQWKKDGTDISGANAASYTIEDATSGDAGSYTCVVSDAENSETSDAVAVTVLEAPVITTQPVNTNACYGKTVQLEVAVTVNEGATYQWKRNGSDISGETGSVIEFVDATPELNDIYSCFIDDVCGSLSTNNVTLNIYNQAPKIELGEDRLACLNEEVVLSAGLGYSSFLWSTGETTQTISVLNEDGDYFVKGTDVNGCEGFSDTTHITFVGPYQGSEICIVTVDSVSGKNMVIWEKTANAGIESYNVWREGSTVHDSVLVENVAFDALSVVVDEGSQPELKAHRYWITAIDTCGNESGRSKVHKTMLLTTGLGPDRINLSWLEYEVQDQPYLFVGYLIYRSPFSSGFTVIDSIASGSPLYPDIDPPAGTNYYRVAGIIDTPCEPESQGKAGTGPYSHSLTNLDDNKLKETGVDPLPASGKLRIYPNPSGDFTMLSFENPGHSEYTLFIRDLSGKLVHMQTGITGQEIRIDRGSLKPGWYHVELAGEMIFRAKMILQ